MEKKFSLKTAEGCKKLIALFIVLILLFSFVARAFQNDFGKIKVEQVNIDSRGAALNCELYYPVGTSDRDSLPGIVVTHGGGCTLGVTKGVAAELARRGFVVLNVSAYGCGLSDQPIYDEANQGVEGFNMMQAINGLYDALCYLRSLKFVDATRIGSVGHSMGAMRTLAAAALDAGYLSLNDQMFNVLYEEFGEEFTEEEIKGNPDEAAQERLNEDQLAHYYTIKEAKEENYNTRVKAEIPLGIGGGSSPLQSTVSVAGHEVVRSIQTNVCYTTGALDSLWNFDGNDNTKNAWYAANGFSADDVYVIDDLTGTSSVIGNFHQLSIKNDAAYKEAIDNRQTRILLRTANETHSKEFFSKAACAAITDYFTQTLNYNRGDLTDASTVPMSSSDQIWVTRAVMNLAAMLSMFGLMIALAGLLLKSGKYAECEGEIKEVKTVNKKLYWIFNVAAVVLGFVAIYLANKNGLMFFNPSMTLPLGRTCMLTIYFLLILTIGSVIMLACNIIISKKSGNGLGLGNLNLGMGLRRTLKCLGLTLIIVIAGYYALATVDYFFGQDFRFWMLSLGTMKIDWWWLGLRYLIMLFPMYLIIGASVNYSVRTDIPEWKETLIVVVANSLGVWLCCAINIILAKTSYSGTLFSSFICSYQFCTWVPITVYFTRKLYNMTKNIWCGALLNSCLIMWSMLSTLGVNDTFYGPHFVGNFFNF